MFLRGQVILALLLIRGFSCLRSVISSKDLLKHSTGPLALSVLFRHLRSANDYGAILSLLRMNYFDMKPHYDASCCAINVNQIRYIFETYFQDKVTIGLLLSPECIMSFPTHFFNDSLLVKNITELPDSLLSASRSKFFLKRTGFESAFRPTVICALDSRSQSVDWVNLVRSYPHLEGRTELRLDDAFGREDASFRNKIFFHLTYNMITFVHEADFNWILQQLNFVFFIEFREVSRRFRDMEIQNWNLCLFKFISLAAFYSFCRILLNSRRTDSIDRLSKFLQPLLEKLTEIYGCACRWLESNVTRDLSLENVVKTIQDVYLLFVGNNSAGIDVNRVFMSIINRFHHNSNGAPGDWMLNLTFLFYRNYFKLVGSRAINLAHSVFFGHDPTYISISQLNNLLNRSISKTSTSSFFIWSHVPDHRLVEIFEKDCAIISGRIPEIPFEIRHRIVLKAARSLLSSTYSHNPVPKTLPHMPSMTLYEGEEAKFHQSCLKSLMRLIEILDIDQNRNSLQFSRFFTMVANHAKQAGDIESVLGLFFELFLSVPLFYYPVPEQVLGDPRPVIVLSPAISPWLALVLGEMIALSVILGFRIPFILPYEQVEQIRSSNRFAIEAFSDSILRNVIENGHFPHVREIEIIQQSFDISNSKQLARYMKLLQDGLESSVSDTEEGKKSFKAVLLACNVAVLEGIRSQFKVSGFSNEELYRILFF